MTGYHITLGYNSSGHNGKWDRVKHEATALAAQPQAIVAAIEQLRKREATPMEQECAVSFADTDQLAFRIRGNGDDEEVALTASGGDPGRTAKEETRRAYCRVLLERVHALGIEINIHVA